MSGSVSQILRTEYGIEARAGGPKVECPFCGHKTFSVTREDSFGKCWRPSCGKTIAAGQRGGGGPYPPKSTATVQPHGGCTLAQYAEAKGLPIDFLAKIGLSEITYVGHPAVRIPYKDASGNIIATRFRLALQKSDEGNNRFRWKSGDKPCPYGLWRLEEACANGYVALVEGESDCHTLWHHDIPALGIPGATMWKEEWADYLSGIPKLYVVVEPDSGGDAVREWIGRSRIRDRVWLIEPGESKDVSGLYLSDPEAFPEAWQSAMGRAVSWAERERIEAQKRRVTAWEQCQALTKEKRILDRLAEDVARSGVAGEERAVKLLYLAATSRVLDRPVSAIIKGPSSSGKSYVAQQVLSFFPASAYYDLTGASEKAFAYSNESLSHRMLVVYEAAGLNSDFGCYVLRSLLSEGRIRYQTVEKTPQGLQPRLIECEGPTGLVLTTTRTQIHPENETRALSIPVTDTPDQTRSIMLALAEERNEGVDFAPWHALQEWIETGECRVVLPYARVLAGLIPPVAPRLRRDFTALMGLIRAHALLHQENRDRDADGRIVATLEDYAIVRELVLDLLSEGVEAGVSDTVRETVEAIERLHGDTHEEVASTKAARELGLDKSTTYRRIQAAIQLGYVINREERKGRPARLVPGDPLPDEVDILPSVEAVEGCMVAGKSGEIDTPPPPHTVVAAPETCEERAAIMEHDGGIPRDEADRLAAQLACVNAQKPAAGREEWQ